jgi:hypothetical protein
MMKLLTVAGAIALVACGSGKPWDGSAPPPREEWPRAGAGGAWAFGAGGKTGGSVAEGGEETESRGGTSPETGGFSAGGCSFGGHTEGGEGGVTEVVEGGSSSGGGAAFGGISPAGGSSPGGGSDPGLDCLVNVSHCFDAAANCFEYSPASDCDQIVDVCAAMQADCAAATP